jgi:hypothetical protein
VKYELIARYVREYNAQMIALSATFPERIMLMKTEELNDSAIQRRLFEFAGVAGRTSQVRLNVRNVVDGISETLRY